MKNDDNIKDWRSTGRRKARRALFAAYVPFQCVGYNLKGETIACGKTTIEPPKDAPTWFEEIWPEEKRVLNPQSLQADHETKDVTQNDIEHLNWRCASCHKLQDQQTAKGVQTTEEIDMWGNPIIQTELSSQQENQLLEIMRTIGLAEPEKSDDLWGL